MLVVHLSPFVLRLLRRDHSVHAALYSFSVVSSAPPRPCRHKGKPDKTRQSMQTAPVEKCSSRCRKKDFPRTSGRHTERAGRRVGFGRKQVRTCTVMRGTSDHRMQWKDVHRGARIRLLSGPRSWRLPCRAHVLIQASAGFGVHWVGTRHVP